MIQTAKELGIGDEFLFEDMLLYSSSYEKPDTDLNLAWSGVGQYKDIMTPMQMCMLTAAVANDGVMMQPRLLYKVVTRNDYVRSTPGNKVYKTILPRRKRRLCSKLCWAPWNTAQGPRRMWMAAPWGARPGPRRSPRIKRQDPRLVYRLHPRRGPSPGGMCDPGTSWRRRQHGRSSGWQAACKGRRAWLLR